MRAEKQAILMTNTKRSLKAPSNILLLTAISFAGTGCLATHTRAADPLVPVATRAAGVPAPDIEQLLGQMTLEEKVGQMTQASRVALQGAEVRQVYLGSVLNGAENLVNPNTPEAWADAIDRLQMQALVWMPCTATAN
jgi:beta-glucosidase